MYKGRLFAQLQKKKLISPQNITDLWKTQYKIPKDDNKSVEEEQLNPSHSKMNKITSQGKSLNCLKRKKAKYFKQKITELIKQGLFEMKYI